MKIEINISKFGDYGLLFADLLDALLRFDHTQISTTCERMAQLANQKKNDAKANAAGVVKP